MCGDPARPLGDFRAIQTHHSLGGRTLLIREGQESGLLVASWYLFLYSMPISSCQVEGCRGNSRTVNYTNNGGKAVKAGRRPARGAPPSALLSRAG